MTKRNIKSKLDPKKRYLQIALNSTLDEAYKIIDLLPISDRIIIEAGTPLIKRYGEIAIRGIRQKYMQKLFTQTRVSPNSPNMKLASGSILSYLVQIIQEANNAKVNNNPIKSLDDMTPYIVADLKTMDRGETEVQIAASAGASAVVALGAAPTETVDSFISACRKFGLDAMIDMMNVEFPLTVLRALKKQPAVVILHRGVDEEKYNRQKQLPLHEIQRIKANYNTMIAVAGGDSVREVQSTVFNDADIVVIWKSVYQKKDNTIELVNNFLTQIK